MRYIPRNCIANEAVLARPILGANGEILLKEGVTMRPSYIKRLEELGISGAYVDDPISEDLEIVSALSDEIRAYAVKNIFSVYTKATQDSKGDRSNAILMMKTAETIVDEILGHGDVMLNLFDMKAYDSYTFFHCVNLTVLSVVIGIGMGYNRDELVMLAYAALLHDIGKVFIAANIINKPGKLTNEEYDIVKKHPRDAYEHIKKNYYINVSELSARGVLEHHERFDSSGYPDKKKGTSITPYGRILAIADVYDALVSDRPYRKGMFAVEAMEFVQGGCGTMFDYDMVSVFTKKVALFPVGSCVKLSDDTIGLVMANYEGFAQRPLLKVFKRFQENIKPYFLNLHQSAFDVTIVGIAEL